MVLIILIHHHGRFYGTGTTRQRQDDACHRTLFAKPNHPWTNGQVERMDRTIKEAAVRRYHYDSHDRLRNHLGDFVTAYKFANQDPQGPDAL